MKVFPLWINCTPVNTGGFNSVTVMTAELVTGLQVPLGSVATHV